MEYSTLIQDFLDGELDESQESALFYKAASDEAVRSEFKSYMSIDLTFQKDSRQLIPPPSVMAGVFSRIGFPSAGNGEFLPVDPVPVNKMNFFRKYYQNIITGVFSSAITALIFLLFINISAPNGQNGDRVKESRYSNNFSTGFGNSKLTDEYPRKENYSHFKSNLFIDHLNLKNKKLPENNLNTENRKSAIDKESESGSNKITSINKSQPFIKQSIKLNNEYFIPEINNTNSNYNPVNPFNFPDELVGLSVEYRGLQEWSLDNPTLQESSLPKFNNTCISIFYSVSKDFMLGIDARQEYFYQQYTGYDEMGNELIYKQFPNLRSIGMSARYKIVDFGILHPYVQLTFGGNKAGYIGRGQLGFEFSPDRNYSFIISGEYSVLDYFHDNVWFISSKFGLNYGIRFNF